MAGLNSLPNELIALICMNVKLASQLRKLRTLDKRWNAAGTQALYSHLDVSLDGLGLMKLDTIAYSCLAGKVKSITFRRPRQIEFLSFDDDDESDFYSDQDSAYYVTGNPHNGYEFTDGVSDKLVHSLRRLLNLEAIEIASKITIAENAAEDYDINLRAAVLDALGWIIPPKLRNLTLHFNSPRVTDMAIQTREKCIKSLIRKVSMLDVQVASYPPDDNDTGETETRLWSAIVSEGVSLAMLRYRHSDKLCKCCRGHNVNLAQPLEAFSLPQFVNLKTVDLQNFSFDAKQLALVFASNMKTLKSVKLCNIRIKTGFLSSIFKSLMTVPALTHFKMAQAMYEEEWQRHHDGGPPDTYECGEQAQHWPPSQKLWNLFCSLYPKDWYLCRDLLLATNDNCQRLNSTPAISIGSAESKLTGQIDWLLELDPPDNYLDMDDGRDLEGHLGDLTGDQKGMKLVPMSSYPLMGNCLILENFLAWAQDGGTKVHPHG